MGTSQNNPEHRAAGVALRVALDLQNLSVYCGGMCDRTRSNRPDIAARAPTQRSRVSNGRSLFASGGDGRGPWARRLRDLVELHLSDLGGADRISEAEKSIVRRAATIAVEL